MHDLIDGILKYSRVGRLDVPVEKFSLYELVNNICNMLVVPDNVKITIQKDLPSVQSGKIYIEQVFQNLISNSLKFMDKENGHIEIGFIETGNFYRLHVKDNGPGIEDKYFDKIFQIFQTLKPRDEFESTGVGLSIVKKIIENYGGNIWVESQINNGTTFFFTLPKKV
jgi:light-regulated signal transduction histidine kinase (bacteriophytochrome)